MITEVFSLGELCYQEINLTHFLRNIDNRVIKVVLQYTSNFLELILENHLKSISGGMDGEKPITFFMLKYFIFPPLASFKSNS